MGNLVVQFKIGLEEKSTLSVPQFKVSSLWPLKYLKVTSNCTMSGEPLKFVKH